MVKQPNGLEQGSRFDGLIGSWCEINVKSFVEEYLQNSASNNTKKA